MTTLALDTIIETYRRPRAVTYTRPAELSIFQRLNNGDKTAAAECLRTYGNTIWEFANKYMDSFEQAEALSREIFEGIWHYAETSGADCTSPESDVIRYIAVRCLYTHQWNARQTP